MSALSLLWMGQLQNQHLLTALSTTAALSSMKSSQPMSIMNYNVFMLLVEDSGQIIAGPLCIRVAQVQTAYVCKSFYNPL